MVPRVLKSETDISGMDRPDSVGEIKEMIQAEMIQAEMIQVEMIQVEMIQAEMIQVQVEIVEMEKEILEVFAWMSRVSSRTGAHNI
jgi:hypothetical protein